MGRVPGAGVPGAGRGGFYKFFNKKKKKEKLFGCHFVIRDDGGVNWVSYHICSYDNKMLGVLWVSRAAERHF